MADNILLKRYFNRSTLTVARSLVGKYLIRENGKGRIAGKIVEVEAYVGCEDKACHASKGRTARTEVLFGPSGSGAHAVEEWVDLESVQTCAEIYLATAMGFCR